MRKIRNPYLGKVGYNCFGCCPDNPIGLHMEFFEDGDDVISYWRPQDHYQGWVGVMHGGILSTICDEIAAWVVSRKLQTAGVTSRLEVNYRHPVNVTDSQLTVRAHIKEQRRNIVIISVTIANSRDEVCVESEVTYFALPKEKSEAMGFSPFEVEDEQLLSM